MRILSVLLALFLITACEPVSDDQEQIASQFKLEVHWVNDNEMRDVIVEHGDQYDPGHLGYSVLGTTADDMLVCKVYMNEPRNVQSSSSQELIGHEVMHCLYGEYH